MKNVLFTIFLAALTALIISCKGNDGAQGPAGPALTGSISGYTYLVDQNDSLLSNRSGVTVSLNGTNISATSDSTGKWTLNNVSTGVYEVTFSKSGYDSFVIPSQQFVGGGALYLGDVYMAQKQTFGVISETAKDSLFNAYGQKVIYLTDSLTQPIYTTSKRVAIFVGTTSSVSSDPSTYSYVVIHTPATNAYSTTRLFTSAELVSAGFATGDTIYFRSYGASEYFSSYRDTATGRLNYTGLSYSPSNVTSTVVP
ncbi:MAG TPA: carboxypeptidase regulatory-like domain-containing protein [Candidatus Kapabacteria bacterium]|nr:carboxypeptidase regulatory-like domain-containing protein [Candidatus Kapabacteria bacterium]